MNLMVKMNLLFFEQPRRAVRHFIKEERNIQTVQLKTKKNKHKHKPTPTHPTETDESTHIIFKL